MNAKKRRLVVGTAIAYLLFFELIRTAGPSYATLVTYLVPPIALAYGAIFLGERFGTYAFVGLALILGGVALATGGVRPAWLRERARRWRPSRSSAASSGAPPACSGAPSTTSR